jgi:hypothetical protein
VRLDVVHLHLDRTTHRRYRHESLGHPASKSRHLFGDKGFFLTTERSRRQHWVFRCIDHDNAALSSFFGWFWCSLKFFSRPTGVLDGSAWTSSGCSGDWVLKPKRHVVLHASKTTCHFAEDQEAVVQPQRKRHVV